MSKKKVKEYADSQLAKFTPSMYRDTVVLKLKDEMYPTVFSHAILEVISGKWVIVYYDLREGTGQWRFDLYKKEDFEVLVVKTPEEEIAGNVF